MVYSPMKLDPVQHLVPLRLRILIIPQKKACCSHWVYFIDTIVICTCSAMIIAGTRIFDKRIKWYGIVKAAMNYHLGYFGVDIYCGYFMAL